MHLLLQRLLQSAKKSLKGETSSCFRVSFMQKVNFRVNCLILFCKGARLGLLTPFLVVYPKLCGQTMFKSFV
jgi:hypothetical protein